MFFHSGKQGEEILETAEFQPFVRSEEELAKWSTDDSLTAGQKALLLLSKGFNQQKASVLSGIYQLSQEAEFPTILETVERELPGWEETLQVQAGSGMLRLINSECAPGVADVLMRVCLALLSTWSHPVHEAWIPVFEKLVNCTSAAGIKNRPVVVALALGEPSQSIPTRALACKMLAILSTSLKSEFRGELLQRSLVLCQDPSFDIRKRMCAALPAIIHSVDASNRPKLLEEVIRLIKDDEVEVRKAAVTLLGQVLNFYTDEEVRSAVAPLVSNELMRDADMQAILGKSIGAFLQSFSRLSAKGPLNSLFAYCKSIQERGPIDLQATVIAATPQILSVLYTPETSGEISTYLENYWSSEALPLRKALSSVYHTVLEAFQCSSPQVEATFLEMLQDSATCWEVIAHLHKSFKLLSAPSQNEVLKSLKTRLLGTKEWRKVAGILNQIPSLAQCWKMAEALEHIQPAVLNLLQDSAWYVRNQCVGIIATLIHYNYYKTKRLSVCNTILNHFGQSNKFRNRILYITFCTLIVAKVSKSTFEKMFFPLLLTMAADPISSVRMHLAATLPAVGRYFTGEEGWSKSIGDTMKRLAEDQDKDVVSCAQSSLRVMSEHQYWESSRTVEIEDAEKVKYEARLDQLELSEQEEEKKIFMQELTRKARLEYLEQYKASSRRSTSRTKPSSNRNTPTRVKKRNSMSQEKVTNGALLPPVRPIIAKLPIGKSDTCKPGRKK